MPTNRRTRSPRDRAEPTASRRVSLPRPAASSALDPIHRAIVSCERCPRLRGYCLRIARDRRAAYRNSTYWARPVPGFGDAAARLLVVGLAPGAHGANRTGRVFTGDGIGGSGDFLMRAMHAHGFASEPRSRAIDDGLELRDAYIAAAVRCAPPDNKPTREEFARCQSHLEAEWNALPNIRTVICLGRLAFDACWRVLERRGLPRQRPRPAFAHGRLFTVAEGPVMIAAYHPSRQNTNTGRLTATMLADVFGAARQSLVGP